MSSPILSSREFAAECGENATLASMFSRPRSTSSPRRCPRTSSRCRSSCRTRPVPGPTGFSPSTTSALLAWTYRPRQLRLVDPKTTFFVFAVDDDHLVVLQALHVLALHVGRAGCLLEAFRRLRFAGIVFAVLLAVVDDDAQLLLQLFEAADDLRLAEIVGNDAHLGLFRDGLIEQLEDRLARFEAHPGEGLVLFGMRGLEFQALSAFAGSSVLIGPELLEAVHERLRGDEAARERDVQLTRIRFAPQLDLGFLRLALAEPVLLIHEDRRHAIGERRRRDWRCGENAPTGISESAR